MTSKEATLHAALERIADTVEAALEENHHPCEGEHGHPHAADATTPFISCTPKALPSRLLEASAQAARMINPVNAPALGGFLSTGPDAQVMEPARICVLTSKYWGGKPRRFTVSFMETTPADLRTRILSHMNAWTKTGGISFVWTAGTGQVRISRGAGGYWSYLGTDVLLIPQNRPTMNLQGFTMSTPESEYKRVVRHETGHTLGFPHEHMRRALVARIDPQKAYAYFWRTQRWDKATVDAQVLTPLDERSIMGTPADQTSIMCYQLPGSITRDGQPIKGGTDINATDYAFTGKIYPKLAAAPTNGFASNGVTELDAEEASRTVGLEIEDDWAPSEDVSLSALDLG